MANVNANVNVIVNTKQAQSQIASFQSTINAFNKSVVTSSSAAVAQQAALNKALMDGAVASRMFTAKMVPVTSSVDAFSRSLEKGKFSLGQYTRLATSQLPGMSRVFRKEFETINRVAESNVRRLQTQFTAAGTAANGMNRAIALTPTSLNSMAAAQSIANQRAMIFNKLMRDGSTSLLNWGKNTQWAGRQLMVGFTIPLTIFAGVAAKTFKDLEAQAINFKKVYGDIFTTDIEVEKNLEAVKGLSLEMTKYGIAVKDTMELAGIAAQSGLRGVDLMEATTQATRLAVLGQMEQAEAMKTVISLQTAFQQSNEELGESVDFLNIIENQTVLSLQDVAGAIPRVAPVIKGLGGDVKDLAVLLVAMREGGVSAAEGANALKNSLGRLINPTTQAKNMALEFGINLEEIVKRNKGEVLPMIQDLASEMKKLGGLDQQKLLSTVFGKFQYARIGALMKNISNDSSQAARAMDLMSMSAEDLAKTADQELAVVENAVSTKFTAAMERAKVAIAPIGELFLKAVTPLLNGIASLFEKFENLPDGVKNAIGIIAGIIGGLAPVGLMVIGLLGNLLANGLKFINFLRLLFAKLTGTASKFNDMAIAEQEAAMASDALEGRVGSLTKTMLLQQDAVQALITLYGNLAGAASSAAAAMPTGFPMRGGSSGSPSPFSMLSRPAPDFRGFNDGVVAVPGSGNQDTVPALLTPGESVVTKEATQKYGAIIAAMNAGTIAGFSNGLVPDNVRFARRTVTLEGPLPEGVKGPLKGLDMGETIRQKIELMGERYVQAGGKAKDFAAAIQLAGTKTNEAGEVIGSATVTMQGVVDQLKGMGKDLSLKAGAVPRVASGKTEAGHLTESVPFTDRRVSNLLETATGGQGKILGEELFPGTVKGASGLTAGMGKELNQLLRGEGALPADFRREFGEGRNQLLPALAKQDSSIIQDPVAVQEAQVLSDAIRERAVSVAEEAGKQKVQDSDLSEATRQVIQERQNQASELAKSNAEEAASRKKVLDAAETAAETVREVRQNVPAEDIRKGIQEGTLVLEDRSIVPNLENEKVRRAMKASGIDEESYRQLASSQREVARGADGPDPLKKIKPASIVGDRPVSELTDAQKASLAIPTSDQIEDAVEGAVSDAEKTFSEASSNEIGAKSPATQGTKAVDDYVAGMKQGVQQNLEEIDSLGRETGKRYDESVKAAIRGEGGQGGGEGTPPSSQGVPEDESPKRRPTPKENEEQVKKEIMGQAAEAAQKEAISFKEAIKKIFAETGEAFKVFPRLGSELMRNFEKPLSQIKKMLGQLAAPYVNPIIAAYQKSKKEIVDTATKIASNIKDAVGSAITKVKEVPGKIMGGVTSAIDATKQAFQSVGSKIKADINAAYESAKGAADTIKRVMDKAKGIWADRAKIGGAVNAAKEKVGSVATKVKATARTAGEAFLARDIKTFVKALTPDKVQQAVSRLATKISDAASQAYTKIIDGIKGLPEQIKNAFDSFKTTVKETAKSIFNTVKTTLVDAFNNAKESLKIGFNELKKSITETAKDVKQKLSGAFDKVKTDLKAEFDRIKNIFKQSAPEIKAAMNEANQGNKGAIRQAGLDLANSIRQVGVAVKQAGKALIPAIAGMVGPGIQKASMGISGLAMAASFAGGEIGEMAQKIMPVSMGLMAASMMLPLFQSKMGLATLGIGALVGSFIWLRKQLDDTAKKAAKFGANLGGMANSMEIFSKATGFTTPLERSKESLFRFNAEDKEVISEFQEFFQSEGGGAFLKEFKELSSEERYSKISFMLAQAIANGYEPEKARQFGQAVAFEINDAMLGAKISAAINSGTMKSGSSAAIDLVKTRQNVSALEPVAPTYKPMPLIGRPTAETPLSRRLGTSGATNILGEAAAGVGVSAGLGAGIGAGAGLLAGPGAVAATPVLAAVGAVVGTVAGLATAIPNAMTAMDELSKSVEYVSRTFGSSIQVMKELANAEALLMEERSQNLIGAEEFAKKQAEIRAAEEEQTQRIMKAVQSSADSGATQQAISDQLVFAGFEGDLASAVSRAVDRQEVAQKVFGDSFENISEQQQEIVGRLIAQTLRGMTPENAAGKIADIEKQYARISDLFVEAISNGLSQVDIREAIEKLQLGDWAKQTLGSAPDTRTPREAERGAEAVDPRVENIMAQQDMINRLGLDLEKVTVALASIPDIDLANEIAGDPEKLQDFIRTLQKLQDPDLANIPVSIAVEYIYEDGLSPEQFKQQMGNVSKVFGNDTEKMIKHAKEAGIAIREFSSWGQNLKDLPQDAITRLGVEMDDPESIEKFGPFAEQVKKFWPILENLNKEIDMSAYIEYLTTENGEPVSVDEAVKRTKKLNKAWSELEAAETLEARKQAVFDLRTLKDGKDVSEEELTGAWDHLIEEFGSERIFNLPTDRLNKAFAISMQLETDKKQLAEFQQARTLLAGLSNLGPEERRALNDLDRRIAILKLGVSSGAANLAGTVNFGGSRDTGSDKGGKSGGKGEKSIIEQLKENVENLKKMAKLVTNAIAGNKPAFKNFVAGPFAMEFIEYLKSQGEKAVKELGNNAAKFKQAYRLFVKERALELKMALAIEKQGYKDQLKAAERNFTFMSGFGGGMAQRESVTSRFGEENMALFLRLDEMTKAQRQAEGLQGVYKGLKKNLDLLIAQAPRITALDQMKSFGDNIKSANEEFTLFNTLIARGFSPTFAQRLIDLGVGMELLKDNTAKSRAEFEKLVAQARKLEGQESGKTILTNITAAREDLFTTFNIMAKFPGITQETIDAMKSMGVTAESSAEQMKMAFNGVRSAASIAKMAMDAFSRSSMLIDASMAGIQRQIERINRIEIRPLEQQIKVIENGIKAITKQVNAIQKTIKPIEKEVKEFEKVVKSLEKEIRVYDKQIKDLEKTMRPLEKENEALREVEKEINEEFEKREKALDQIEKINARISAQQRSQLSMAKAIAEGDIYAVAAAMQQYRAEQAQMNAEQTRESLREGNERRREEITKKIEANEKEIKNTNEQIEGIQERIEAIQDRIEGIQEQIESRTERIADLNEEIADLQERIADEQERIADLQDRIEASKEKQLALEEKIYKLQLLRSMLDTAKAIREAVAEGDVDLVKLLQAEQQMNLDIAKGEDFGDLGVNAAPILGMAGQSIDPARVSEAITNGIQDAFLFTLAKMGTIADDWISTGLKGAEAFKDVFTKLANLSEEDLAKFSPQMQAFLQAIRDKAIEFPKTAEELQAALIAYGVTGNDLLQTLLAAEGLGIIKKVDETGSEQEKRVNAAGKKGKDKIDTEAEAIGKSAANLGKKVAAAEKEFEKGNITFRQAALRILSAMAEAIGSAAIAKVDTGGFNNALKEISGALQTTITEFSSTLSGTLDTILTVGNKFKDNIEVIEGVADDFGGIMTVVSDKFEEILQGVSDKFGDVGADFNTKFQGLMKELVDNFGESIKAEFGRIVAALQTFTNDSDGLPSVLGRLLDALSGFVDSVNNAVGVLNSFLGAAIARIQQEQTAAVNAIIGERNAAVSAIVAEKAKPSENKYAGGIIKGYAMGGKIKKYPMGGKIPYAIGGVAGDGARDSVNAMLTPGEFVVRKSMVKKYGQPLFESINQGSFSMPKYNMPNPSPTNIQTVNSTANINAPVYNNYDMDFAIHGTNASADEIANKVMFKIKQVQNQGIRSNRGY